MAITRNKHTGVYTHVCEVGMYVCVCVCLMSVQNLHGHLKSLTAQELCFQVTEITVITVNSKSLAVEVFCACVCVCVYKAVSVARRCG